MMKQTFSAMGTTLDIVIPVHAEDESVAGQAIDAVKGKVEVLEGLLSRFRSDSEVSRLNAHPGHWLAVHPNTFEMLSLAKEAFERTNGVFNPCLGLVLEGFGYDVSFHTVIERNPERVVYEIPYVSPTRLPYQLNDLESTVFLEPGYKIDLGGIGKGWIVKQAASVLEAYEVHAYLLSAGGDMVCRGMNGSEPWCVGIQDPFNEKQEILKLDVVDMSIATSGTYRRKWIWGEKPVHHLLDPFLGTPIQSDVISCTVVHRDLVEAEVFAKVALILGRQRGQQWLKQQAVNGWVMVTESGEVIHSWNS